MKLTKEQIDELTLIAYEKAKHYTDVECSLQNFFDEDEITIQRLRYVDGYLQAFKDTWERVDG
jgi:hypothetical protein